LILKKNMPCVPFLTNFQLSYSVYTETMIISNNKNRSCIDRHCFYFRQNQLESCTEYKYLGVIFNNKGKLNNSAENGCLTVNTQNIIKDHIFNFFK
jgi:hypothetical protein